MPTNVYFDTGTTNEQRLYEDLIVEQLKIYGQDVYYLPRKIANKDTIFNWKSQNIWWFSSKYVEYVRYMNEQEIIKSLFRIKRWYCIHSFKIKMKL